MDINGCHVVPEPSNATDEGFLTTIQRDGMIRGPFNTIQEAITAAHAWNQDLVVKFRQTPRQVDNEAPVVVKTTSESIAVQIEKPADNPPVIQQKALTTDTSEPAQARS